MLINRMIRAARLDVSLYEEVEADPNALSQAVLVVIIASVCSGIGNGLSSMMRGDAPGIMGAVIVGLIMALVGWFIWSLLTYLIGTALFKGTATYGELLRTIGFSDSPGVLAIFSFIPLVGGLIAFAASIWSLIAMVVAVRQALDFSTGKAIATVLIAFLVVVVVAGIVAAIAGVGWLLFYRS